MSAIIGHAVDKRPGAEGRRARYDVYAVTAGGQRVRVRLREFIRPDGTAESLGTVTTDVIEVSRHRLHVHLNATRRYAS